MTDDELIAQYLDRGGQITKCPPGPSEKVVYTRGYRAFRPAKRDEPKPAGEAAPAAE